MNITLNNGVEMPALGLGVFQTPPDETRQADPGSMNLFGQMFASRRGSFQLGRT